ncbi:DUF4394 domain-containing protein [Nostoc sp. ChiQUE01b]|uniref:DUF4394 domain-containing protein n=1 Tax=Nostoc sp. ChiQUE01b TaxID=3075376 RepID=UPI002AD1D87D|nr:DUF4394 domain-containing protein [Nostoc sp. ChiQUE01b]MDZ8263852.1 DUF4394 domain-containing protein [Nostoc sp. ChiQUE01b]
MKGFFTRKIALVVAVLTVSLGLSANKTSANVGIIQLADILQINVTGKWSPLRFIGLTSNNTLVNIDPSGFAKAIQVKGIDGNLQGIDFRPANGVLYGVTDTDNIYTINFRTGQATLVSKLSSSFNGGFQSGFDFNPVPDRLRIVGSNDQNFRTNVDTGAVIVDKTLAYATDDVNATADPNITAVGYTNSVAGATSTQLFGIDYDLDVLVLQNPPNDGTLRTIGKLGVNFAPISGFDIFTNAQGKNTGYALSGSVLYTINLSTGVATQIANVPKGNFIGLAVISK